MMPIAKNQWPMTIDDKHHQRYRVLAKYQSRGIYLTEVKLVRKLLYVEFYRDELTIVNESNDYSNAG